MEYVAQTYQDHTRAIWKLGTPLILSNLAMFAIHITDTIMLGWYDVTALAASTIAGTMFFIVFIVGAGFAQAVTPMVAAAAEEDDERQVRRVTRMGLWLSLFYGAAVTLPFFWAEDILIAIGQDPDVAALAHLYLQIVIWQMIPALIVMTMKSFLAALEHTAIILWATIGGAIVNVFVNYALIFGNWGAPELGIVGAAIASVVTQTVSVLGAVLYVLVVLPHHALFQRLWRADWEMLRRVFRLGWPIGLTSLSEVGLFAGSAVMMGWLGAIPLAAHGIALQLASITFMVHLGLANVATIRAGNAVGRQDRPHLVRGARVVIVLSLTMAVLTIIGFVVWPEPLISLFMQRDEPARDQILAIGVVLLVLAALFQLVDGAQAVALGLLRGVQDTTVPMVLAGVSYWVVGLPTSYGLGFVAGYGAAGIWMGLVVGLACAAALLMLRFWRGGATQLAPVAKPGLS